MNGEEVKALVEELKEAAHGGAPMELTASQVSQLWGFLKILIEITQLNSFNEDEVKYLYELSPISRSSGGCN